MCVYVSLQRVMPTFFFILARYFLRIDGVLFRIYDTRYFHRFGEDFILRETQHREEEYDAVMREEKDASLSKDSDRVAQRLRVVSSRVDEIVLSR